MGYTYQLLYIFRTVLLRNMYNHCISYKPILSISSRVTSLAQCQCQWINFEVEYITWLQEELWLPPKHIKCKRNRVLRQPIYWVLTQCCKRNVDKDNVYKPTSVQFVMFIPNKRYHTWNTGRNKSLLAGDWSSVHQGLGKRICFWLVYSKAPFKCRSHNISGANNWFSPPADVMYTAPDSGATHRWLQRLMWIFKNS